MLQGATEICDTVKNLKTYRYKSFKNYQNIQADLRNMFVNLKSKTIFLITEIIILMKSVSLPQKIFLTVRTGSRFETRFWIQKQATFSQ